MSTEIELKLVSTKQTPSRHNPNPDFAVDDMDDTVLTLTDQPWNLGDWQLFV